MKTLAVDGNNLVMRAVKACEGRVALSSDGVFTAPVMVVVNMLSKYVREEAPDRVVVCWDGGRSEMRVALFPDYKAQRSHKPPSSEFEDYKESSFALVREFLSLANIHHA